MHRGTGMIISLGAVIIAWWLFSMVSGEDSFNAVNGFLNSIPGTILMVIWTFCTCYHLLNGIRHLVWDAGYGFELDQAYLSGKLVVAGSVVLTVLVWLI